MKNGPEIGATSLGEERSQGLTARKSVDSSVLATNISEAEIGEIPIAQRGAGRGHQHLVDGGHQAAKQGARRRQTDRRSSLGHCRPFLRRSGSLHHGSGQSTYTRCQEQCVCLHSSILSFATQHRAPGIRESGPSQTDQTKRPPETGGL